MWNPKNKFPFVSWKNKEIISFSLRIYLNKVFLSVISRGKKNKIVKKPKEKKKNMLTFACNSVYDMIPLPFFEEGEYFAHHQTIEDQRASPNHHLEVGAVIARVGPVHFPYFVQALVGMLHFGIIKREIFPSIDIQKSSEIAHLYFEDKRWLRNYYLKRQYFERFQVQHYVKHTSAQVKETSLGAFLFGEDHWNRGTWYNTKFLKSFMIMIPNRGVEQLRTTMRQLRQTLWERKYSLLFRNCESYCMEIAGTNVTSVQVYAVLAVLIVLVILSVVIIILLSRKKRRSSSLSPKTNQHRFHEEVIITI